MIRKTFLVTTAISSIFALSCTAKPKAGTEEVSAGPKLSYEGYSLKFEDNFDGDKLDTSKWGFEFHEPGWVNNELQSYDDNI